MTRTLDDFEEIVGALKQFSGERVIVQVNASFSASDPHEVMRLQGTVGNVEPDPLQTPGYWTESAVRIALSKDYEAPSLTLSETETDHAVWNADERRLDVYAQGLLITFRRFADAFTTAG